MNSKTDSILSPADVRHILTENGVIIPNDRWTLLEQWITRFKKINEDINLVSRKETDLLWERHILPCLALLTVRKIPENVEICDFGTGGGFPGIPIALARPDLKVTLLDSRQKKIRAIETIISPLLLTNIRTVAGRGEELSRLPEWNHSFPVITARAVTSLENLEKWTRQLRLPASTLHIFKGGDISSEIKFMSKIKSIVKIQKTQLKLKGYPQMEKDEKYIISLHFK